MKSLTTIYSKFLLLFILSLTSCLQEPAKVINRGNMNYNKKNQFNQDKYRNIVQNKSNTTNSNSILSGNQAEIKQGDTLYSIAKKHDVSLAELIEINNLEPPYSLKTGTKIKIPASNFHESRDGDTLYSISRIYDMKVNDLIALNNLQFPYSIYPGDKLKIVNKKNKTLPSENSSNIVVEKNLESIKKNNSKPVIIENKTVETKTNLAENLKNKSNFKSAEERAKEITEKDPSLPMLSKKTYKPAEIKAQMPNQNIAKSPNNVKNIITPSQEKIVETKLSINKPIDKNSIKKIASKNNEFCWPVRGTVISKFGPKSAGLFNDGINIKAQLGQSVVSSEDGIVAYVGDELKGYGNLVIIKHAGGWISAYAHLKNYGVELGQKIEKGQKIGIVGNTGKVKSPQLYFGLRKGRDAVNPENYLKS